MFSVDFLPGLIMGIREGLEAFLIIAVMLEFLNKSNRQKDKKHVFSGLGIGLLASIVFGLILFGISLLLEGNTNVVKLWEFGASFVALVLITTFLFFMIKHKDSIVGDIQEKVKVSFTKKAIISLAAIMVAREGAEIVLFVFASAEPLSYGTGALFGVLLSSVVTFLIYKSLIKVNLKVIFSITLFYLILQAGFMLGYSVHELFSYFKAEGILESTHWYYTKLFDLSGTFLDHKEAPLGILLYASIGYYSKPEVLQFVIQYVYTISILVFYFRNR